jgi:hypothetical protein
MRPPAPPDAAGAKRRNYHKIAIFGWQSGSARGSCFDFRVWRSKKGVAG